MTRFRISLAILLVLLGISIGSMAAVRYSGNAVLEAVQQVSETASPTAAQCEAVETAWEKAEPWLLLSVRRDKLMDTSNSVYRLKPLLESDCDEFTAELKDLQSNLQFLIQEDGFSFLMLFNKKSNLRSCFNRMQRLLFPQVLNRCRPDCLNCNCKIQ